MKFLPAIVCLLLLLLLGLTASAVDAARPTPAGTRKKWSSNSLFVFGDDLADNGNLPLTEPVTEMSRQWSYPYGSSYVDHAGFPRPNTPTGRFSNYRIQSDFIARILGLEEAPPAYAATAEKSCDPSGMTFAYAGAGVFNSLHKAPTLANQVDTFNNMVKDGTISKQQLSNSVALVAISGNDYAGSGTTGLSSIADIDAHIEKVTTEIAANVERLHKLGVNKVLVNNLHPVGCTPSRTRTGNYTACDIFGDYGASLHNNNMKQVMAARKNIHIVDLYTAFSKIINNSPGKGSELSKQFKHKLSPCCESFDSKGYCGQQGKDSELLYSVCDKSNTFFYWDDMHPTDAGWEAVMKQLQEPLKEFLDQA